MLMVTMSRMLSELLGVHEATFAVSIQELERASGLQSVDVRLAAEIVAKVHGKTRALGLDPRDTNGRELYHGLQDMVRLHDEFLVRLLGGTDPGDVEDLLPRIVHVAQRVRTPRQVWVIKHSVGKRLLRVHPPRRLMKSLGYRSLDSLLKREPIDVVFAAMRFLETSQWQQQFVRQYSRLQPSDFELRNVEVINLQGKKWEQAAAEFIQNQHHNITHSKEMGAIIVLPLPVQHLPGITITVLPLLLHYINEIRLYSALFKLQQVKPNFGSIIAETILHDPGNHVRVAGQGVHWRVVQQHFGQLSRRDQPELFEPHVQPEDLEWRSAEDILFNLEPALQFWHGIDFVGSIQDGQRISFNLMDAATNFINQLPFDRQVSYHMQRSLWNELNRRYISQPAVETHVLRQLEHELVDSDVQLRSLLR